jgi:CRP/FNR family cyclic AMP-dependent transcriptional regulator
MTWEDGLGFLASTAVLATFCMRQMVMLRLAGLASNVLFAAYGYVDHLPPVLLLHLILFPVNLFRLFELLGARGSERVSLPNLAQRTKTTSAEMG